MSQVSTVRGPFKEGFGQTDRKDNWWLGPLLTVFGLTAFLVYGMAAALQNGYFEIRRAKDWNQANNPAVAPYLAPFYSPLIYDPSPTPSHHAWIKSDIRPSWLPSWIPLSPALLILAFPGLFRFTCYYYRKAYYRAFWADPFACAVGEPRKGYWGENRLPMILQNVHRYAMYAALVFLILLTVDAVQAFWWPNFDKEGNPTGHGIGMGVGSLIMVVNVIFLAGFTFGCNSVRHLVGGRMDCFTCPNNIARLSTRYRFWRWSTILNERHMEWAWLSLFSVGFTDLYIRLCAMGYLTDVRFF